METICKYPINQFSMIQINSKLSQVNVMAGSTEEIILRWTNTKRRTTTATQTGKILSVADRAPLFPMVYLA